MYPHVSIIILNWNNWRCTLECLESLYRIDYDNFSVILVDNHSSDDSITHIERYCTGEEQIFSKFFPVRTLINKINLTKIQGESNVNHIYPLSFHEVNGTPSSKNHLLLIENDRNYGFAEGNNIGIRFALEYFSSEYFLLLNNDTIQDPKFLKNLIEGILKYPLAGFAGPKIYYYDYNGRSDIINHAGVMLNMWIGISIHRGDKTLDIGQYNQIKEVDSLTGACLLVRRDVIKKIGLLNPDYFLYWEETDWCIRGHHIGFSCVYLPSSKIWHHLGSSAQGLTYQYYYTRNRFWFIRKHATIPQIITFLFFFFFMDLWYNLFRLILLGKFHKNTLFAFFEGIYDGISRKSLN